MTIDQHIKKLDETFQNNYDTILKSANTLCKSDYNDNVGDIINDAYLKIRNKIQTNGFKGNNYMGYIWMTIRNEFLQQKRSESKRQFYSIEPNNVVLEIMVDQILNDKNEELEESRQYHIELMDITKNLFEYIEVIFDEKQVYLFKNYYLIPNSTYKKLSKRTGYTITDCSLTIKEMKKKIKADFVSWYKFKHSL